MAAVTINQTPPISPPGRHVLGDLVVKFFNVSGVTGSTLATGLINIQFFTNQQSTSAGTISLITAMSQSAGTITFTSSGPMVNEVIMVVAREG